MGKRFKAYKRLFREYEYLGFRQPYQILFTAEMIEDTIKLDIVHLLEKTLRGTIKPMITSCAIRVLYQKNIKGNKDAKLQAAIDRAKGFERCRCGHLLTEEAKSPLECLLSVVDIKGKGNKYRYCVATQDIAIRQQLRAIPVVPLIYCHRSVIVLEPMSATSESIRRREEMAKFRGGLKSRSRTCKRKREVKDGSVDRGKEAAENGDEEAQPLNRDDVEQKEATRIPESKKKKKTYGKKEPNPLSVKKPKKIAAAEPKKRRQVQPSTREDPADVPKPKRKRHKKNKAVVGDGGESGVWLEETIAA